MIGLVVGAIQKIAPGCSGIVLTQYESRRLGQIGDAAVQGDRRNGAREGADIDLGLLSGCDPRNEEKPSDSGSLTGAVVRAGGGS
jgi:hypothetical protein